MSDWAALGACVAAGGVAVFPADTVYGLACDPENADAVARLYALKGRAPDRPAAVMWFDLTDLPEMGPRTAALLAQLLPGGITALLPNPQQRFPLACGPDPSTLGLRVPFLAPVGRPVMQSSANVSGGADARVLSDVPAKIRAGADLVIDGGELLGTPSTVVDLREYESGRWSVVREGAVASDVIRALANGGP